MHHRTTRFLLTPALMTLAVAVVATVAWAAESLSEVAANGDAQAVAMLLRHGADVDQVDGQGMTPLMHASRSGHASVVRLLAAAGADLEKLGPDGKTAAEMASGEELAALFTAIAAADAEAYAPVSVVMTTSLGKITIELDRKHAPVSVANFLEYVDSGFYDGTVFHRVISGFLIQGGGFTTKLEEKEARAAIANEWQNGLKNERGTISMGRLPGRADSATSQFFINVMDNPGLDEPQDGAGYAVFGKVTEGMDVVDKIGAVETAYKPLPIGRLEHAPLKNIVILSVVRSGKG